ncbi:hypothetical protein ACZ90_63650 [Streptomyces albus subsp. albus]|nr:hypothetical protein ACZ90_63650 [Streptomyces albus subsp. albus]
MGRDTVSGRTYRRTRVRGFAPWSPRPETLRVIEQVQAVLNEYREHLPMTARQVFYRLVGHYSFPKDELAYDRLQEYLNRARRARMIPMEAIRDDRGITMGGGGGYEGPAQFWEEVQAGASAYHRPLDEGQPRAVEVWVEAVGMLPMIANVTSDFGVPVYGSGGFESVAAKHDAAQRIAHRQVPTTVLSIGDLDPSGLSIVDAAADDVAVFVEQLDAEPPTVIRLAVTGEQAARYQLETAPQKGTDRRGAHMPETVQAEALSPDQLTALVKAGLEEVVDLHALDAVRRRSERERRALMTKVSRLR